MGICGCMSRLLLYLVLLPTCQCQGLNPPPAGPRMGANSVTAAVLQQYKRSKTFRLAWKNSPKSSCSKSNSASLCAAAGDESADQYAQLMLATSPAAYSSTSPLDTGGRRLVSAPQAQGPCDTCVAFALASAVESAITSALALGSVTQVSISVQSIYYCANDASRECDSGMTLLGALDELSKRSSQFVTSDCLGYRPDPSSTATKAQMCSGTCDRVTPQLAMGKFEYRPITAAWKAQRHIREFGGVISKFQVFDDFKPFFEDYANALKVYSPGTDAQFQFNHAVFVVGYNLEQEYFYVKNSWGANWGEDGYFRVAFGCCGLLEEAYGLVFVPHQQPPAAQLQVTRASGNANCFLYQAKPGDYLSRIAAQARIPLDTFMLDNADRVKNLDEAIQGKQLLLCRPAAGTFKLPATPDPPRAQPMQAPAGSGLTTATGSGDKPVIGPTSVPDQGPDCTNFRVACTNTSIWMAISYQVGSSHVSKGWWELTPGDNQICYPAEARKLKTMSYYFTASGFYPYTSMLAFDNNEVPWPGGNSSMRAFCVDTADEFAIQDAHKVSCNGANQKQVVFLQLQKLAPYVDIQACPVCYDYTNECTEDLLVAHTTYEGSSYATWGWHLLPAEQSTEFCYTVEAAGDVGHVAVYFWPKEQEPELTVNWPGKDYADGQFCTDDKYNFEYSDAHQMECDGKDQLIRSFWRMAVPVEGFTVRC